MKSNKAPLYRGTNFKVGGFLVNRLMPSDGRSSVGAVFFLEHLYPINLSYENSAIPVKDFSHPHRGIATLSYVLNGSLSHYDSKGNHDIISAGGLHWMKAGNGIVHNEKPFTKENEESVFQSVQFWINLPSEQKENKPEYKGLQSQDIPEVELPEHSGIIRILLGEFGCWSSPLPTFNTEFIYHIRLNPNSTFSFLPRQGHEVAAFVPATAVLINDIVVGNSKMLFTENGKEIILQNDKIKVADIFLFGGAPYNEPIVAEGPFVMNSYADIATAYKDFFNGSYGTIEFYTGEQL